MLRLRLLPPFVPRFSRGTRVDWQRERPPPGRGIAYHRRGVESAFARATASDPRVTRRVAVARLTGMSGRGHNVSVMTRRIWEQIRAPPDTVMLGKGPGRLCACAVYYSHVYSW
jgi:hypothetical protein